VSPVFVIGVFLQVFVPVFVGTVLLVVLASILVYRYRVNVFIKFNLHPFNVDKCEGEDMSFDAFVCCAGEDDQVARTIVHCLEHCEPGSVGYRVCYHARDFPLGGVITASIEWAIEHSKRVVCLMSNDFVASEMCMLEFYSAWQLNIDHRKHRLIVIKWPDLDLDLANDLDPVNASREPNHRNSVKMFLSKYTYIEYDSDTWWRQVLYAMPINRLAPRCPDDQPPYCLEPLTLRHQEHQPLINLAAVTE